MTVPTIPSDPAAEPSFEPPGPGVWQRDEDHWPRPVPLSYTEIYSASVIPGVKAWTSRYGLLLDYFETAFVNGFGYGRMHAVGEPEDGGGGPPPKLVFQALLYLHPELRSRRRAARRALDERLWLEDLARWDDEVKPAIVAKNRRLAGVDRAAATHDELIEHARACRENLKELLGVHHRFNGAMLPVGLLVDAMRRWTGSADSVLPLLEGASPISSGRSETLTELAAAIRDDEDAQRALEHDDPEETLRALEDAGSRVRDAYQRYVLDIGYRLVGDSIDHGSPTLVEVPGLMVRTIRRAVDGATDASPTETVRERADRIRSELPAQHREEFDRLLSDTLATYRLRDERSVIGDVWAAGIFRQALLEIGRRLVARGRLTAPEHAIEASFDELTSLLEDGKGPDAAVLAGRADFRERHAQAETPAHLGGEPGEPPPLSWLPTPMRKMNAAVFAQIAEFMGRGEASTDQDVLTGVAASRGSYEGPARVVSGPQDFDRIREGDVLVARTTSEAFNVVLPLLGAIVTDRGGVLSHAAIVARESKIPCVVATGSATERVRSGQNVRVDGDAGEVWLT